MKRIKFTGILLCLTLSLATMAQQSNQAPVTPPQAQPDSLAELTESQIISTANMIISDQLDSLVNTWYVKNSFDYNKSERNVSPELLNYLPDSVYLERLKKIDSYIYLPYNETVKNLIGLYTIRKRAYTEIMLGLSNFYFPIFEEALERYQLPHELKYLPIIESALNPKAISRAGAGGLWQFMPGTGKLYGLEINTYIDERNDPYKASDAAARMLKELYSIYGDWHLVIAAYNCGPGNVNKAIRRNGGKQNYWEIYYSLPRETRNYIPIFIAATYMMNYHKEHGLIPMEPKFRTMTDTIQVHEYLNLNQVANSLNLPIDEIRELNPQYRRDVIPAHRDKPYILKLPADQISAFIDKQPQIFAYNRDQYFPNNQIALKSSTTGSKSNGIEGTKTIVHVVKRGESPGSIAAKYRVNVNQLKEWNRIHKNMIHPGQRLNIYVPDRSSHSAASKSNTVTTAQQQPAPKQESVTAAAPDTAKAPKEVNQIASNQAPATQQEANVEYDTYIIRKGDNLDIIAKKFPGTTYQELKSINNIRDVRGLMPGQVLRIPKKA